MSSATDRIQKAKKESLWDDYAELVLNVSEDQRTCFYYFVNPIDRRLFWVDEVNVKDLFGNAFTGVNECSQISTFPSAFYFLANICLEYLLEEHYWYIPLCVSQVNLLLLRCPTPANSGIAAVTIPSQLSPGIIVCTTLTVDRFPKRSLTN